MAPPMPRPRPGNRFAPKMMTMMARMMSSSGNPMRPMVWLLRLLIVPLLTITLAGQFASGVNLVEVYATVMNSQGDPVTNLGRDAFQVFEDGAPQTIAAFTAGDVPLSIVIALDRSF